MNTSDQMKKLEILLKAEGHVMRFQKARLIRGIFAGFLIYIFLTVAYVLANVAGFLYLFEILPGWKAALYVSGFNVAICIVVIAILKFQRPSPHEQMALELRQIARQQVCSDVQEVIEEVKSIEMSIRSLRDLLRSPAAIAGAIGMVLAFIAPKMKAAKRKKADKD